MKGCLLCLQNHKENVGYIQVNSTHWMEFNIRNIIEKHLWPIESIQPSSFICTLCWEELYGFHKFFMAIKAAQTKSFEKETEPHSLQMSKKSTVSLIEDEVKPEHFRDRSSITEFRYEPEIIMEQSLPTATQRKYTSTSIVKLEDEVSVYNSSYSIRENSHTDLCYDESDETNSIVTEINETEMFFNLNRNLEIPSKDIRHEYMQITKKTEEQNPKAKKEVEDAILDESFLQHINKGSHLPTSNSTLHITNEHTVKPRTKRGRPRKNFSNTLQNKEIVANPTETQNQNSFISIQQEGEYEEDISLKKKKRGRPKNSHKNRLISEQKKKMWANSMISRPARKRNLPRKYLTYDIESTTDVKIKKNIHKELYLYLKSGKRGRPRKILINSMNGSNISLEQTLPTELIVQTSDQQHQNLCYDNIPKKSTGKRGRPRKYFTKDVGGPQELCSEMPSTSTGKRGRPRKYFTNDIKNTELPKEETVASENSIQFINNHPRVKSKLKNRKRCRPYRDLMRNYIATSVRCMQLFKSKNSGRSESENSCNV